MTERKPTCVACKGAGGGATYTAGDGIKIESNEISADTSVLATKTELPDMDDYQEKLTAGTGIDITENVVSADTNVLALKSEIPEIPEDFELYTSTDWSKVIEVVNSYIVPKKDCLIIARTLQEMHVMITLFKGVKYLNQLTFACLKPNNNGGDTEIDGLMIRSSNISNENPVALSSSRVYLIPNSTANPDYYIFNIGGSTEQFTKDITDTNYPNNRHIRLYVRN